jgi:hypothetical protein
MKVTPSLDLELALDQLQVMASAATVGGQAFLGGNAVDQPCTTR